jgi:hypothetical protein
MEFRFNAEEWNTLSQAERIRRCRILAHEAESLAAHSAPHTKAFYLELGAQWKSLADEMQQHAIQTGSD